MKKLISILLVIVLVVGLVIGAIFLSNTDKTKDPTQPTIIPTEEFAPPNETTEEQVDHLPTPGFSAVSDIDIALQEAQAPRISWTNNQNYDLTLAGLGFKEVILSNYIRDDRDIYYNTKGEKVTSPVYAATVYNIQFVDNKVRVEFDWYDVGCHYNEEGWVLYCAKADEIADISGLNIEDYDGRQEENAADYSEQWKQRTDFVQRMDYVYYKGIESWAQVYAYYYPESGNLYNLVNIYDGIPEKVLSPLVLNVGDGSEENMLDVVDLEFIDGYPIVTSEFGISCNGKVEYYKYRVGMTLSNWAASELNTSGWVVGFDNTICSPDYRYQIYGFDNSLTAHSDFLDDHIFEATESTADYVEAMAIIMDTPLTSVPIAHLVDWQSPFLVDGFVIEGKHNPNSVSNNGYQMFNMGYVYEVGETLDIYIKNIQPDMLADVRLYVIKDSIDLLESIETIGTWQSHNLPLPSDSPMLTIPEDATYLTFEETPNTSLYGQDKWAVTHYDMNADPNFNAESANAFVLTYRGKVVYWIHMPVWMSEFVEGEVPEETEETEEKE